MIQRDGRGRLASRRARPERNQTSAPRVPGEVGSGVADPKPAPIADVPRHRRSALGPDNPREITGTGRRSAVILTHPQEWDPERPLPMTTNTGPTTFEAEHPPLKEVSR